MLTTVIFDMDGLLIDSEPLWRASMKEVFATVGVEMSIEQAAFTIGLRTPEVVEFWHGVYKWNGKSQQQVTNEIIDSVIAKINAEGQGMEGLEYILDFFHTKGYKVGLASSSPMRLIQAATGHLNIDGRFTAVCSAELESHGKPHPAVYLSCATELKSHPLECVAFEDSITGLIAAKAARMKAVVIPEEIKRTDLRFSLADLKLDSLLQFNEEKLDLLQ